MEVFSEQLDFPTLLAILEMWLGSDLCVMVHRAEGGFNIGFCARLEQIRRPEEAGGSAVLDFEGAKELTLPSVDGIATLHTVYGSRGVAEWIEISLAFGMVTTIERVS